MYNQAEILTCMPGRDTDMYVCIYVCVYMYVRIYVSMYVCMYVGVYVCMHECAHTDKTGSTADVAPGARVENSRCGV